MKFFPGLPVGQSKNKKKKEESVEVSWLECSLRESI